LRRRRRRSQLESLVENTSLLPWWVSILLAVLAYLVLHAIGTSAHARAALGKILGFTPNAMWRALALQLQYFVPLVLLVATALSLSKRRKPRIRFRDIAEGGARTEPTLGAAPASATAGHDLYQYWKATPTPPRPDEWSLDLLRAIDWKRFEEVCAEYFRLSGFHATTTSHGADGGIDIVLYEPNNRAQPANIVQCKQWKKQVGPKAVRELLGVMTDMKAPRGVFVTSSVFNDEARRIAADNRIQAIDGPMFLKLIRERFPAERKKLLEVATGGDYLTPSCPSCGIKLVRRENRRNNSWFWGCPNYPRCHYILNTGS